MPQLRTRRTGFSYLELQVSFTLFAIALGGIAPLVVMQSRHLTRVEARFDQERVHYLTPSNREWARKLGASAAVTLKPLDRPNPPPDLPLIPITIDDGDPGYVQKNKGSYDWFTYSYSSAYESDGRLNSPDSKGDKAIWIFTGLPPAKYKVYATYSPFRFAATNARYRIYQDAKLIKRKKVNQTKSPPEPDADGKLWRDLGTVEFFGQELRVELRDKPANGYIVVDAVRVVPEGADIEILAVTKSHVEAIVEARVQIDG